MLFVALTIFFAGQTLVEQVSTSPASPSLEGKWQIVGNDYSGVLEIQITPDNQLRGQIYGEQITGQWNPKINRFDFTRYRNNQGIQVWTGEWKEGNKDAPKQVAELKGTFRSIAGAAFGEANKAYDWNGQAIEVEESSKLNEGLFVGHTKSITAIAWSNDSSTLITGSDDRSVRLWDASKGTLKSQIPDIVNDMYGGPVYCFGQDLKMLAVNYWGNISIRSLPSGKPIRDFTPLLDRSVKSTFRPDVYAMSFSPDGKLLATAGSKAGSGLPGGIVIIWQLDTGKPLHIFDKLETAPGTVAWSNDGTCVAAGTNGVGGELPSPGEVLVWNVSNGEQEHKFKVKSKPEYGEWTSAGDVCFSPDGQHIAVAVTAGSCSAPAGVIIHDTGAFIGVWDLATGNVSDTMAGPKFAVSRIQYSPDGKRIASVGPDQWIRMWDANTGQEIQTNELASGIVSLGFDPSGKTLAVGCKNGRISLVSVRE